MGAYQTGRLGFNSFNNRYGLLISDLWEHNGFHCGESLEIEVNGEWVQTAFEMNRKGEWYLKGLPQFHDSRLRINEFVQGIEYLKARIKI